MIIYHLRLLAHKDLKFIVFLAMYLTIYQLVLLPLVIQPTIISLLKDMNAPVKVLVVTL